MFTLNLREHHAFYLNTDALLTDKVERIRDVCVKDCGLALCTCFEIDLVHDKRMYEIGEKTIDKEEECHRHIKQADA